MSDEQAQHPETKGTAKRKAAQRTLPLFPAAPPATQGAPKALTKAQQLREALRARQGDVKRTGDALRAATKTLKRFLATANAEHAKLLRAEAKARKAWDKALAAAEKVRAKLNGAV